MNIVVLRYLTKFNTRLLRNTHLVARNRCSNFELPLLHYVWTWRGWRRMEKLSRAIIITAPRRFRCLYLSVQEILSLPYR